MTILVREAGRGAIGSAGGRVMAAGAGWAWLRDEHRYVHLTSAGGPRSPLTAVVERVPVLEPGDRVRLDPSRAREWRTPAAPQPAGAARIADACAAVRPHVWNDPRAVRLGAEPDLICELAGAGPGLTPAGDDVLLGYMLALRAVGHPQARERCARVLGCARRRSGGPSLALLRWAARGEAPEPAAVALAAIVSADGPSLAPAVRRLAGFGRTTGPAILAGLAAGAESQ